MRCFDADICNIFSTVSDSWRKTAVNLMDQRYYSTDGAWEQLRLTCHERFTTGSSGVANLLDPVYSLISYHGRFVSGAVSACGLYLVAGDRASCGLVIPESAVWSHVIPTIVREPTVKPSLHRAGALIQVLSKHAHRVCRKVSTVSGSHAGSRHETPARTVQGRVTHSQRLLGTCSAQ